MNIDKELERIREERGILRDDFEGKAGKLRSDIDCFLKSFDERVKALKNRISCSW